MRNAIAANENELKKLRMFDAKSLASEAGVHERTAIRAKAGERVHPFMLRALLEAASTLQKARSAA